MFLCRGLTGRGSGRVMWECCWMTLIQWLWGSTKTWTVSESVVVERGRGRREGWFAYVNYSGWIGLSLVNKWQFWCVLFSVLVPQWQLHLTTIPTSLSTSLLVSTAGLVPVYVNVYMHDSLPPNPGAVLLVTSVASCCIGVVLSVDCPSSVPHRYHLACSKALAGDCITANTFVCHRAGAVWLVEVTWEEGKYQCLCWVTVHSDCSWHNVLQYSWTSSLLGP